MVAPSELSHAGSRPSRPSASGRAREAGRALLQWTPVWVPLAFLCQLVVLGLVRAGAEAERLDGAEMEVRARVNVLEEERDALETQARMLADEIYQERVRRSLLDPAADPLTLESQSVPRSSEP